MSLQVKHSDRPAVLVFMRRPEPGRVKTRLAEATGPRFALDLYVKLVKRALAVVGVFKRAHPGCDVLIFYTPEDALSSIEAEFGGPWRFLPQAGGHLGRRMECAFDTCWELGYREAVLVGTDICDLQATDLEAAFSQLEHVPVVLGPAADGGFYLVGLRPIRHHAFRPEAWSTPSVYSRTLNLFRAAGLMVRTVAVRHDLDTVDDLHHIQRDPMFSLKLSVIVPTLQQPETLQPFLDGIRRGLWPGDEIVLAHPAGSRSQAPGQSSDRLADTDSLSRTIFRVPSEIGRGRQLDSGAQASSGDLLWFLHDDCRPPLGFAYHVRTIANRPDHVLGCFMLEFLPSNSQLALIAAWANLRSRLLHRPYGDQGLFCRRAIYDRIGGFSRTLLMEDVSFVRRAMAWGKLVVVPEPIHTSPGRYLERGIVKASFLNHLILLLHHLRVSDRTLYRLYYGRLPGP